MTGAAPMPELHVQRAARGQVSNMQHETELTKGAPVPRRNNSERHGTAESGWENSLKKELTKQWEARYGIPRKTERTQSNPRLSKYRGHTPR